MERAKLDGILKEDAFKRANIADYEVIDFSATSTVPELAFLHDAKKA